MMASEGMSPVIGGQNDREKQVHTDISEDSGEEMVGKEKEEVPENKKNVGDLLIAIGEIFGDELVLNQKKDIDKNEHEAHIPTDDKERRSISGMPPNEKSSNSHNCEICKMGFKKKIELKEHLFTHSGDLKFKCDFDNCGWSFKSKYKLERHQSKHSANCKFKCPFDSCDRSFNEAYKLKSHIETHTAVRKCEEEHCDFVCASLKALKSHKSKVHSQRIFKCFLSGCNNAFASKIARDDHVKLHRRFVCPFPGCQKPFTRKSYLDVHARSHTNERPFKCSYQGCYATFTSSSKLNRHQKSHVAVKPFACTFKDCDSSFKRKDNLNQHINMHHCGESKFLCPFQDCNSKFSAKSSLKEHISLHTKHEIYKCPIEGCKKAYYSKNVLRTHVKRHQKKLEREETCLKEKDARSLVIDITSKGLDTSQQHTDISVNEVLIPAKSDAAGYASYAGDYTGINSESTVIAIGEAVCFHYMNSTDQLPVIDEQADDSQPKESPTRLVNVKETEGQNVPKNMVALSSPKSKSAHPGVDAQKPSNDSLSTMTPTFLEVGSVQNCFHAPNKHPMKDSMGTTIQDPKTVTTKFMTSAELATHSAPSIEIPVAATGSDAQTSHVENPIFSSGAVTVPLSMTRFLPREIQINELFHNDYSDDHAYNRSLLPVDPRTSTTCDNRNIDNAIETALTVTEFGNSLAVSHSSESLMEMRSFLAENGMASFLANDDVGRMETCSSQEDLGRTFERSRDLGSSMMLDECIITNESGSFNHFASNDSYVSLIGSSQIVNEHLLNLSNNPTMIDHMYSQHSPEEDDLQIASEDHVYEESTVNIQDIR